MTPAVACGGIARWRAEVYGLDGAVPGDLALAMIDEGLVEDEASAAGDLIGGGT
jgi:hypothetical protein